MNREAQIAIEVRKLEYARGSNAEPILRDVSFAIRSGEWVSIVGANGSGKSTLIRLLNGLLWKSHGNIRIGGMELTAETVHDVRGNIGMIFSNPDHQFVGMSVKEDIVFGLENKCLSREEMNERLVRVSDLLQLGPLLDRHPSELSGGQKQRVAIASILALEPDILVLDEASSMLDEASKLELLQIIRDLRRSRRYTVVCVTHDWDEIMASDRVLVISGGTLAGDLHPEQLCHNRELLERCRLVPPFLTRLQEELRLLGCELEPTTDAGQLVEALWAFNSRT